MVWPLAGVDFSNTVWWDEPMKPRIFWTGLSADDKRELASKCKTSVGHLSNIFCCNKKCGEELAILLEKHSGGLVVCEALRPDIPWSVLRNAPPQPGTARKCV